MRCMFCGHGRIEENRQHVLQKAREKISSLIEIGVEEFWSGGMGAFDEECEHIVREIKKGNPRLQLYCISPDLPPSRQYYQREYDGLIFSGHKVTYYKAAIPMRNQWMVDHCDFCLSYVIRPFGGAYKTLSYAKRQQHMQCIDIK